MAAPATTSVPHESLYCAEQIHIPSELPDVLKNYTKHILRTQPADIIASSAEYFGRLTKQRNQASNKRVSNMQLEAVYVKFANRDNPLVLRKDIDDVCTALGISYPQINDIVNLGNWKGGDRVPWLKFWALLVASSSGTLHATMESVSKILGDNGAVPANPVLDVLQFLGENDHDVEPSAVDVALKALRSNPEWSKEIPIEMLYETLKKEIQQKTPGPTAATTANSNHTSQGGAGEGPIPTKPEGEPNEESVVKEEGSA
ncbi:hypothetical protein BJ742DRAFT_779345 [Cladochytrium replicatum]|nr:hypothetical protein BJ742DRAFT_779345 [Cladochytrium replicatum]